MAMEAFGLIALTGIDPARLAAPRRSWGRGASTFTVIGMPQGWNEGRAEADDGGWTAANE
jgi:hypothetical protein